MVRDGDGRPVAPVRLWLGSAYIAVQRDGGLVNVYDDEEPTAFLDAARKAQVELCGAEVIDDGLRVEGRPRSVHAAHLRGEVTLKARLRGARGRRRGRWCVGCVEVALFHGLLLRRAHS